MLLMFNNNRIEPAIIICVINVKERMMTSNYI